MCSPDDVERVLSTTLVVWLGDVVSTASQPEADAAVGRLDQVDTRGQATAASSWASSNGYRLGDSTPLAPRRPAARRLPQCIQTASALGDCRQNRRRKGIRLCLLRGAVDEEGRRRRTRGGRRRLGRKHRRRCRLALGTATRGGSHQGPRAAQGHRQTRASREAPRGYRRVCGQGRCP